MYVGPGVRVVASIGLVTLFDSAVAYACSCDSGISRESAHYDQVFLGEALEGGDPAARSVGPKGCSFGSAAATDEPNGGTLFRVKEAFVGVEVGDEVWIAHDDGRSSCATHIDPGDGYLVYAIEKSMNGCSPGLYEQYAEDRLEALRGE